MAACSGAPRDGEQGRIFTMPKFVCLRDFSKNLHESTQYPPFALQFSQFPRLKCGAGQKCEVGQKCEAGQKCRVG